MIHLQVEGIASPVQIHVRPQVTNILLDEGETSYTYDAAGRLIGAFVGRRNYQRGLDNRVLQKWREDGERQRRWLGETEARSFLESAYGLARHIDRHLAAGRQDLSPLTPTRSPEGSGLGERRSYSSNRPGVEKPASANGERREAARRALAVIAAWDWDALQADRERFRQVYRSVSVLPPDQYLALVLQATEGCSHNACTFCNLYRGRPFRIKSPAEFREHIAQVREFFGPSLPLRKSIFLADANALVIPQPRLLELLDAVNEAFPIGRAAHGSAAFAGIYSFIDAFHVERKSVAQWEALAARGLHRAYVGMESGDDGLLRFLNKPGTVADVVEAVVRLRAAGVAVSVIILLGAGGDRYAESHVAGTIAALNAMPLGAGDLVYFSDFVELSDAEYGERARAAGIRPLSREEMRAQERAIRAGLRWANPALPPQMSRYDIREFIY
ncbi:MAG: radical SAM protein [Anaerolineae bacterium]|nr:radical SAM protein [Anaerolineae bacterium]